MTQKQKLVQLLGELGISYRERKSTSRPYASEGGVANATPWDTSVDLTEGIGFPDFLTSFYFDADETFLAHRVWKK